jgi:hypothetical protein
VSGCRQIEQTIAQARLKFWQKAHRFLIRVDRLDIPCLSYYATGEIEQRDEIKYM